MQAGKQWPYYLAGRRSLEVSESFNAESPEGMLERLAWLAVPGLTCHGTGSCHAALSKPGQGLATGLASSGCKANIIRCSGARYMIRGIFGLTSL